MSNDREAVYDAQIAPLMSQIITLCKAHDIPLVAIFQLSQSQSPLMCSTVVVPEWANALMKAMGNRLVDETARGVTRW